MGAFLPGGSGAPGLVEGRTGHLSVLELGLGEAALDAGGLALGIVWYLDPATQPGFDGVGGDLDTVALPVYDPPVTLGGGGGALQLRGANTDLGSDRSFGYGTISTFGLIVVALD